MMLRQSLFIFLSMLSIGISCGASGDETVIPNPMAMGIRTQNMGFESVDMTENGENARVAIHQTAIMSLIGKIDVDGQWLVPGIAIERTLFKLSNSNLDDKAMYQLGLPVGLFHHTKKMIRLLSIAPSMHTDGNIYDRSTFSLHGLGMWQWGLDQPTGYRLGFGANRTFGRYQAFPIMGYQWRPTPKSELDMGFPFSKMEYNFSPRWNTFIKLTPSGGNWRYENEQGQHYNLSYSSWVATLGLRYRTFKRLWASIQAGRSFERELALTDDDNSLTETDIGNSHFFLFSFGLHP